MLQCHADRRYKTGMDESRQKKILIAAERLVIHYGVSKTTISDIAKEAHIGVGTVYLEFKSKDEILAELARRKHAYVLERMRGSAAQHAEFSAKFMAMMNARVDAFIRIAEPGAHATELVHCACDAVHREFEAFKDAQKKILADLLVEHLDHPNTQALVTSIFRAYATFTPPTLYSQRFSDLAKELEAMHHLVLHGLCASDSESGE